jgi:hypothetical protein
MAADDRDTADSRFSYQQNSIQQVLYAMGTLHYHNLKQHQHDFIVFKAILLLVQF